jgi:hypothetical protein
MVKISTEPMIPVRQLPPVKLKDRVGRSRITLDLKTTFGFVPETLVIEKIHGINNAIRVSAVLTKEELENEKKRNKKSRKKRKRVVKRKS